MASLDVRDIHVWYRKVEAGRGSSDQVVRSGITHVLEGRHIFCEMSVRENLQLAKLAKNDSTFNDRLSDVLEPFPILKPKLRSRGGDLSGGQQQILALARGLLTA